MGQFLKRGFDKPVLSRVEGLSPNGSARSALQWVSRSR
jgi:hypothetical protein